MLRENTGVLEPSFPKKISIFCFQFSFGSKPLRIPTNCEVTKEKSANIWRTANVLDLYLTLLSYWIILISVRSILVGFKADVEFRFVTFPVVLFFPTTALKVICQTMF